MKLSKQTIEILENLSSLNKHFLFREGSSLKSCTPNKGLAVEAKVEEVFPSQVGVFDLSKILSCLKTFDDSELFFNENSVKVANDHSEAAFGLAQEDQLITIKKDIVFNPSGINFDLRWAVIQEIIKYSNLMRTKVANSSSWTFDTLTIIGTGEFIVAQVQHSKKIEDETLKINLAQDSRKFKFTLPIQLLNLVADDYLLEVSKSTVIRVSGKTKPVIYYFASSEFSIEEQVEQ